MHELVLTRMQVKLPSGIAALGVGVEPARERQSEIHEPAEGTNRPLWSNHDVARGAAFPSGYRDSAGELGGAGSCDYPVDGCKRDWAIQPSYVGEEGVDLTAEEEAQVTAAIRAGHQGEPARGQLDANLVAIPFAGGGKAVRSSGLIGADQRVIAQRFRVTRVSAVGRAGNDRGALGSEPTPENLSGRHRWCFIELELQGQSAFELGPARVGALAFSLCDLALKAQVPELFNLPGARHHDGKGG